MLAGLNCRLMGPSSLMGLAVGAAMWLTPPILGQVPCRYEYVTWPNMDCGFGPLPGKPVAVNVHGHVAGKWVPCGDPVDMTFLWTGGPTTTILPIPPGYRSMTPAAMNDLGEIVGYMTKTDWTDHAFLRRSNGQVIDLGTPAGTWHSYATGINNHSEIAGYSSGNGNRAFRWMDGSFTVLDLPVGPYSRGLAINDLSQIAGWMGTSGQDCVGFVWQDGRTTQVVQAPSAIATIVNAIAPNGRVAGRAQYPAPIQPQLQPFVWENGVFTMIDVFPGYPHGIVYGVNDSTVVGENSAADPQVVFVWSNGELALLEELVPIADLQIVDVAGITADGRFACTGMVGSNWMGLLLTPVMPPLGDISGDCRVGVPDLLSVINAWGQNVSSADINDDDIVNVLDLILVIDNWTMF